MTVHDRHAAQAGRMEALFARPESAPEALVPGCRERTASELNVALLAADCVARLADAGIRVEQTSDFELAMETVAEMDKPYLTDFLSPRKNDFFESNCFWLILRDASGGASGMVGARMDDTGREPLSSYSARKLRNLFPEEAEVPIRPDRLPRIAQEISGRVVYTGDLFVGSGLRTTNRQTLRTLVLLLYCAISLKWQPFDWLYAFLRDRDVSRGAPWLYHFPRVYPLAHSWTLRPSVQTGEHWLAAMDRLEFVDMLSAYLAAPHRL
jgi:hypothetical protein